MTRLSWVSLAAALVLTAQAEWTLALAVGWWIYVAWCWPLAVDLYVVASFRAHRDRAWAIGLMAASVAGAHALPRLWPHGMPPLVAGAMSVVPVLVAWRVHEMPARKPTETPGTVVAVETVTVPGPKPQEEPRPAPTAITRGASTPPSDASVPAPPQEVASGSVGVRARGTGGGHHPTGRRKAAAARQPALTDNEALEIGVRVLRDAQPATQADYVAAFRKVRGGDTAVIKRSYAPAREAAAKPQLVAIGG